LLQTAPLPLAGEVAARRAAGEGGGWKADPLSCATLIRPAGHLLPPAGEGSNFSSVCVVCRAALARS